MLNALIVAALFAPCVGLGHGTLHLPAGMTKMEPSHPAIKGQLMTLLGARAMDVAPLAANAGLNGGIWVLSDPLRTWDDMVIKLRAVGSDVSAFGLSEAEHLALLAQKHPGIDSDHLLAFPSKILACLNPNGQKLGDLIVTRKVQGQTLADFIWSRYNAGPSARQELNMVFERVGRQLRSFHLRYGKQHSDFQASNIMVDPSNNHRVTFVDLAGMGLPIADDDLLHFAECVRLLSANYPPASFLQRGHEHFQRGYRAPVAPVAPVAPAAPAVAVAPAAPVPVRVHAEASPASRKRVGAVASADSTWASYAEDLDTMMTWEGTLCLIAIVLWAPLFLGRRRATKSD